MILSSLLLLATAVPCRAQIFTPKAERLFNQALVSLYNLDYDEVRAHSRAIVELEPDNPFSYLAESGLIWWQSGNEYGLFKDTPTLENAFEEDVNQAITRGQAALEIAEKNKDRTGQAKAHFVIGMAMGTRGEWKLIRRHWLSAYSDGKHGVKHLNRCIKLDPEFYDAYIGLGLYDYKTGHLPKILKLSTLFFIHGNVKRGLQRMQLAYEKARYTPSYAAQYLASIYILDQHDDAKALPLIRYLRARYPQSPYFHFIETELLVRNGDPGAFQEAADLVARARKDPEFFSRKQLSLWCGLYGEDCFKEKGVQTAQKWFSEAIAKAGRSRPALWLALLHFYRGVAYDMTDKRDLALEDYKYVIGKPQSGPVEALAKHCAETVCDRDEVIRQLKSMSLKNDDLNETKNTLPRQKDEITERDNSSDNDDPETSENAR